MIRGARGTLSTCYVATRGPSRLSPSGAPPPPRPQALTRPGEHRLARIPPSRPRASSCDAFAGRREPREADSYQSSRFGTRRMCVSLGASSSIHCSSVHHVNGAPGSPVGWTQSPVHSPSPGIGFSPRSHQRHGSGFGSRKRNRNGPVRDASYGRPTSAARASRKAFRCQVSRSHQSSGDPLVFFRRPRLSNSIVSKRAE